MNKKGCQTMVYSGEKGELGATLKNGFCMQSDCMNWFEDMCSLCYTCNNKYLKIYPFNLENAGDDIKSKCDHYKKGINEMYLNMYFKGD